MAKRLKVRNAVLCEYVAKGERGKNTLINVFSGDVIVDTLPAHLQFGLYFEFAPDEDGDLDIDLSMLVDSKKVVSAKLSIVGQSVERPSVVVIPSFNLGTDRDVVFSIYAKTDYHQRTKVLSKRIFLRPNHSTA